MLRDSINVGWVEERNPTPNCWKIPSGIVGFRYRSTQPTCYLNVIPIEHDKISYVIPAFWTFLPKKGHANTSLLACGWIS